MPNDDKTPTIVLLGHYGRANLGDEATIQAVIQNFRRRLPEGTLKAVSADPADTQARFGLSAYPVRRNSGRAPRPTQSVTALGNPSASTVAATPRHIGAAKFRDMLKSVPLARAIVASARAMINFTFVSMPAEARFLIRGYRFLRGVDVLAIVGSGQMNDEWGGAWSYPFALLKWSLLARLAGTKCAAVSVGAGPIEGWLSKIFCRAFLANCAYRSVRDQHAQTVIREIGFKGNCLVYPDLAHSLDEFAVPPPPCAPRSGPPTVAINAMPAYDSSYWPNPDPEKAAAYRQTLGSFASSLIQDGFRVFFFGMHPYDRPVAQDIIANLHGGHVGCDETVYVGETVEGLSATLKSADFVVSTRFHGSLLSLAMGLPTLAISYNDKIPALMEQMGHGPYSIDIDGLSAERLFHSFKALEANAGEQRNMLRHHAQNHRRALDEQYDRVVSLAVNEPMPQASFQLA